MSGTGPEAVASLRAMAGGLRAGARVSAYLLDRLLDEVEQGGAVRDRIEAHPASAEPTVLLRALAGISHAYLSGTAPRLAGHLADLATTGAEPGELVWRLSRDVLLGPGTGIGEALSRPVQQHLPDRAGHLLHGLTLLGATRVRLLELGACTGLNLLVDRFGWHGDGWTWGPPGSPVRLRAPGPRPGELTVVDRAGCDLAPLDPADPADVLRLRSFVPFELTTQHAELSAALRLAAEEKVRVDAADAAAWLAAELDQHAGPGVTTVVWHSLFWPYLSQDRQLELERLLTGRPYPVARIGFEPAAWGLATRLQITVH
ncbi:DUF2332 family protein [Actinoplanes sp. CA-131856]